MPYYLSNRDLIGDKNINCIFHDIKSKTEIFILRTHCLTHFIGYFVNQKWIEHAEVKTNDYISFINRIWKIDKCSLLMSSKVESLKLIEFNATKPAKLLKFNKSNKDSMLWGDVKTKEGKVYTDVCICGDLDIGDSGTLYKPLNGNLIFYSIT